MLVHIFVDEYGGILGIFPVTDDFFLWAYAPFVLSSSDISDLYTSHDPTNNASDLEGFWKFDGGYTDDSGNGNTLTGQNSPVFSTDVAFSSGGTITTSTTTTYTYATTSASSANPHAVIQITPASSGQATTTFVYDNNGNLIQSGTINGTTTYAWDYRNRMTDSATSTVTGTTTYLYDHSDQRVKKTFGNTVTTYVNKLYDLTTSTATTSASTTAYIWAGDMLVATIEGNGYSTSTYFVHPDHLGSANVITNSAGAVKQAIDYYPFGEERINTNSNLADRTFINQFYDREQSLSYLNARYLQSSRGQFLSQDPVFLSVGFKSFDKQFLTDPQQMNSARTMGGSNSGFASGWRGNTQSRAGSISQLEYLADPQMQNSYAYAREENSAGKRQFLLDVLDSIIFDDDALRKMAKRLFCFYETIRFFISAMKASGFSGVKKAKINHLSFISMATRLVAKGRVGRCIPGTSATSHTGATRIATILLKGIL